MMKLIHVLACLLISACGQTSETASTNQSANTAKKDVMKSHFEAFKTECGPTLKAAGFEPNKGIRPLQKLRELKQSGQPIPESCIDAVKKVLEARRTQVQ